MHIDILKDPSLLAVEDVAAIFASVGFGTAADYVERPRLMESLFGPGVTGFFAFEAGKPVGFLRAFSDGCLVAWIAELCVIPSHQRRGIGRLLIQAADDHFGDLGSLRRRIQQQYGILQQMRPALAPDPHSLCAGPAEARIGRPGPPLNHLAPPHGRSRDRPQIIIASTAIPSTRDTRNAGCRNLRRIKQSLLA